MFAYRYPATKGVLKQADLRTIQSDLYAKQVLLTHPRNYRPTHRSLMAIMEGGDVDWSRVRQLKPELERLVAQARKDMLPKERVKKSPNRPEPEGS
ncbi:hypothetical protein CHT98_32700 (plasmid) [Azospirillum brasilense]|uniref:Uncharacterized protein n=2 Tax=Azospirillum brasilense TaxID=192 RepID=A0A235H3U4_AZOBR|nr:hypothetical protein CHT98_32700 [Azospirillum brasilense]